MKSRQIMITIGVVVAVFAIAFIGAKAGGGGGGTEAAAASVGKVIEVPSAAISASVSTQSLPALKAVKKKKAPKKTAPSSSTSAPPSTNTAPPSTNTAPPSTNTAPPSTNTAPPTNTSPPPSNPNPAPTPVTGGGET